MVLFPNCKINLGLRVVGKRSDGYHNIETVFYPIPFYDAIEITPLAPAIENKPKAFELTVTGLNVPGEPSQNLCYRAWQLIRTDFPDIPPVQIHLHKAIPLGAGLGGGSSDAAATLLLLNAELGLKLSEEQLKTYALGLGSDCPFFILNRPCFARARGEVMEELSLNLKGCYLMIVNVGLHISTAWAFAGVSPRPPRIDLTDIIAQPMQNWKEVLVNDFETPVFNRYPELAEVKKRLYAAGAVYASMTGTGSTVYGLFSHKPEMLPSAFGTQRLMVL